MEKGKITGFLGSWGSGIAQIEIDGEPIPCENGATVRALAAMFPDVIGPGHVLNVNAILDREVYWDWDDIGIMLGSLAPVE